MTEVGIYLASKIDDIFPKGHDDVKTGWAVIMPQIYDLIDCLQIGNKFLFSIGAHATHQNLLLSAKYSINYLEVREIENLLSYLFDTPCLIAFPKDRQQARGYYRGMRRFLHFIGQPTFSHTFTLEHHMAAFCEVSSQIAGDGYIRVLPFDSLVDKQNRYSTCDLPQDSRLKRALAVYRQALFSLQPQGMILNYWRTLEAITTKPRRYQLIKTFPKVRLKPIKVFDPLIENRIDLEKPFNLLEKYRTMVLRYFKTLVKSHGTPQSVLDHFYKNRRNPCAHAERDILDVTTDVSLVSLYKDALLLKYFCRCAAETYWAKT